MNEHLSTEPDTRSNIWNRLSSHQNSKSLSECSFSQKWSLCFTHTPTAIAHPYLRKITASHHAFTAHPLLVPHLLSWPSVHTLHVFCTLRPLNFFGEWHFPGPGSSLAPCLSMIMKYFKVSISSLKEEEAILIASSYEIKRACCTLTEAVTVCVVTQLSPTLRKPMNYSLPGSSVHGILQARKLDCHSFPQRIFLTQGSNPSHCR